MQNPVKERVVKLRDEIVQISEANKQYVQGGKKIPGAPDHEPRSSTIAGNSERAGGAHRLEKAVKICDREVAP